MDTFLNTYFNSFQVLLSALFFHAASPHLGFKIPGYRPSELDKRILVWSGRFKSAEQIPDLVS